MMNWRDRAACIGEDPELFFPDGNTGPALHQTEEAKAVRIWPGHGSQKYGHPPC